MPTALPRPRRIEKKKRPPLRVAFDVLFNGTLILSALVLVFIVLVREEQYAFGQPGILVQASERTAPPSRLDTTGETGVIPPAY